MFRRRPSRRLHHLRQWASGMTPDVITNREVLVKAQELFREGKPREAAEYCEDVGRTGLRSGVHQAPRLLVIAGRGYLLANQPDLAVASFQTALEALAQTGRWFAYRHVLRQATQELESQGFYAQSDALKNHQREGAESQTVPNNPARKQLPSKCISCGAPLHADKVDWIDDDRAECPYCGVIVQGE